MTWLVLIGCDGGDDDTTGPTTFSEEQGVIAGIRTSDGERVEGEPIVFVGSKAPADPDSAGLTYFFDLTPDRVPVTLVVPDHAYGHAAAEIRVDTVAAVSLVPLPFDETLELDGAEAISLVGEGFRLETVAGSAVIEGLPVVGPFTVAGERVDPDERDAIAPVQTAIRDDVDLVPVELFEMVATRAWQGRENVQLAEGQLVTLTFDLDPASPALEPGAEVFGYQLNAGVMYWGRTPPVSIDPALGTATVEVGGFGWFALGVEAELERGCVTGRLVDGEGNGVASAEVRSVQEGILGVDGAFTLDGSFCVAVDPGATAELHALAFLRDRTAMYRWTGSAVGSAPATCGDPTCTDLGVIEVDVHLDGDRDRFFAGPGGDCDDGDDGVNPTLAFGDGSWCGGPL